MSVPGAGLLALLRKRSEPEAGLLGQAAAAAAGAPAAASPAAAGTPAGQHPHQSRYEARSAAVHALEHAVAAGTVGEAARPLAQGRRIPPGPAYTYDVDVHVPHEAQPQLPVTPVTLITTDYGLHHYRQNAISAAYICYGLKQGHVRVLARSSAVRALLKGHTTPLTDLQFAGGSGAGQAGGEGGALLASGGQDGQLYVWHLQLDEEGEAIHESQKLHASFVKEGGASAGDVFLSWHTPSKRVLAVGAGGRVLLVAVPLEGMEQLEFDLDDESTPDATVLPEWEGEAVTCLSFSPDGQLLAAGGAAGSVRVWQLQQAVETAPSTSPVLVAAHSSTVPAATNGAAVGAVRWLPTPGGWVLLTGNRNNASLQLWHAAGDAAAAPLEWAPLQTLRFEGKDGQAEFYNQLDVVPAQQLVVLADTARKAVYTLHYSGSGDQLAFDYVARFGVAVPILSFTALWSPGAADGEASGGEAPVVELHCVQTTAIQQYSLDPALCSEGSSAELDEAEEPALARRSSLLERRGNDFRLPIQAQPSSAVPMPSEELATGTPREATPPAAPAAEQLPVPASEEAVAAAEAAAAPHLEASIDETVPLASIPLPPAPEPPVPKGASGEVTPEECPSPPPTPTEQQRMAAEAAALAAAEAAASAAVVPPAPRLLTPSDLLQSTEPSSTATTSRSSPSSAAESGGRASAAGAAVPQPPVRILQRPEVVLPAAAAAEDEEQLAAAPPSPAAAARDGSAAAAAAGGAVDEAVAAAVLDQMGGVHKRFVGHVSLMYRELLKAMKAELSLQAAAQQQATAQLLAQALEAQKQQIEAERAAVLAEERGNIERLLTAISGTLNRDLPARLQETVRGELSSVGDNLAASVAPAVQAALAASLPKELSSAVKAGLDKQLAPAVAASLSGKPLQEAFRSAFAKQLVPAFEAATQAMFQQIQSAFAAGFEEHLQATRSSLAEPAKLASQLAASLSSAQSLASSLSQGQQQLLRAQSIGGAPSGALSPAAQVDVRGELSSLLRSHQYEQAFSRALGLQDVATVGWLCTQADAAAVLSRDPCPLSQMVLLSLVQQLSADLTTSLAAKLAWIREAALQLNPKDPVLARHLRPVLEGVHTALAAAAARAVGPDAASCRLALHVVHSQMTS